MSDVAELPRRGRQATRQLWSERLARFPQSGLSVTAFCAQEGVAPNSFYYWKRRCQGTHTFTRLRDTNFYEQDRQPRTTRGNLGLLPIPP